MVATTSSSLKVGSFVTKKADNTKKTKIGISGCQVPHRMLECEKAGKEASRRQFVAKFREVVKASEQHEARLRKEQRTINAEGDFTKAATDSAVNYTLQSLLAREKSAQKGKTVAGKASNLRKACAQSAYNLLWKKNILVQGGAQNMHEDEETIRLQRMQNFAAKKAAAAEKRDLAYHADMAEERLQEEMMMRRAQAERAQAAH